MPPLILQLNIAGQPVTWLTVEDAATHYCKGLVAWELGDTAFILRGGISRLSGRRSQLALTSMIAIHGRVLASDMLTAPRLTRRALFRRDGNLCLYCGQSFTDGNLTIDHVLPQCQGGETTFKNCVAACKSCNGFKGGRTPEQAGMKLLAVPFVPNKAEHLFLLNRTILSDQMAFLRGQFRKGSRLLC